MTIPAGYNFSVNADGSLTLAQTIPATANHGLLSVGAGPWDGASAGHFSGSASGTALAVNVAAAFGGELLDFQVGGLSVLKVDANGAITLPGNGGLLTATNQLSNIAGTIPLDPARSFETRAAANQSAPIQKWEDNSGATLASVRSDGLLDASTVAVATREKAGAPVDGDWVIAPPDATLIVDSTNSKLWVRVGGAWKGVAVA